MKVPQWYAYDIYIYICNSNVSFWKLVNKAGAAISFTFN